MKSTFRILFFIRKDRINTLGKAPVHGTPNHRWKQLSVQYKKRGQRQAWGSESLPYSETVQEAVRLNFYFDFFKRSRLKVTKRSANKPIWLP